MGTKLFYVCFFIFVLSLAAGVSAQEPERDLDIPYAFEAPVLDGEIDEVWEAASKQEITVHVNNDPPGSTLDISATWQVMWDVDYLYVIVELFDDSLQNDSTSTWQDDSVEFYFDGGNSKDVWETGNLVGNENNRQTTFGWTTEEVQGNNSNPEGVEHAQVTTPTGWRTEMKIPWISLQGKEPIVGDLIGIECGLNDDDDGDDTRETQMATYSVDNNFWRDPSQWGTALLTLGDLNIAYGPDPSNGSIIESAWTQLKWRANPAAVSHNIYVGEDFDEVNAGTGDTFWGNQTATNLIVGFPGFPFPGGLVGGATYYWRIDEVNEADPTAPWKGMIWSFSIPPRTAQSPDPADGAEFVELDATLTWEPGHGAKLHTLYFGESFEDVNSAAAGMPLGVATHNPGPLEAEKVLYWRIDEFDGAATHKGDVWGFTTAGAAGNPNPGNGDNAAPLNATLTWTPADTAASHQVYLGADADAVRNATTSSPEYMGSKTKGSESHDPGKLAWDTDYFWQVDAVYTADPGNPVEGLVWSFKTADFIGVDDFESYNDIDPPEAGSNRIFDKWVDGFGTANNGALIGNDLPPYAGQIIVHGSAQSMPYFYDNNLKTSEATLTLAYPRDWTDEAVTKLSLWFGGNPSNAPERMFVALNGNAVVYHDDAEVTKTAGWTEWVIDLQDFANQGVNLTNVNTITIGFGTKGSPTAGGSGQMYFDDIQLRRTEGAEIAGLIGAWNLDEGAGDTAGDSSGSGLDGAIAGAMWVSPGSNGEGSCLDFDGLGNLVDLGNFDVTTGDGLTIALWCKADNLDTPGNDPRVFSKAIGGSSQDHWFMVSSSRVGTDKVLRFRLKTDGDTGELKADVATGLIDLDVWMHVAAVWDGAAMKLYKNGVEVGSLDKGGTLSTNPDANVAIGNQPVGTDARPWDGLIDDVRLYDRGLSADEVMSVMNGQ